MSFGTMTLALALLGAPPADSLPALRAAALAARPGDRVTLAPGVYTGAVYLERVRGERDRPITIAGADPANPPTIRGGAECIHLSAGAYVTIENLILEGATGNGINIDDGSDRANPARGITLRNLDIRDIGPDGNSDGIKLSGLTGFLVENCTVQRWGSGGSGIDLVGCSDGTIRACTLRHTDAGGASGIQLKGGTRAVVVQDCRFDHAGRRAVNIGGSTGLAYFRPRPEGFEARDITVEGCTIAGSEAAIAFVGADGATVRFNTIESPSRWVFRILQETRAEGFVPCRAGVFTDNLIVFENPRVRGPNIGDATEPKTFTFARNLWYCRSDPGASRPSLPAPEAGGIYGQDPGLGADLTEASAPARVGAHARPRTTEPPP